MQRLSAILVTAGASSIARMAAGLQLKNQLTSKDLEMKFQYQQRWLAIPHDTREYIKKNVRRNAIRLRVTFATLTLLDISGREYAIVPLVSQQGDIYPFRF